MAFKGPNAISGIPPGGVLPGVVVDNEVGGGKVKVWIPEIHGNVRPTPDELPFAYVMQGWGGLENTGVISMPPVESSVLVGFITGSVSCPVVLGYYYGSEGLPSEAVVSPPDSVLVIQHTSGWVVKLDFGNSILEVTDPAKNKLTFDAEALKVSKGGEEAIARVIHEFGIDTFTGLPLGEATQGATAAIKVSQAPQ